MILERRSQINIPDLKEGQGQLFQRLLQNAENANPEASLIKIAGLMQVYNAAMKGVSTKLEVLDDEFQITHKHNPIHHLECRIKGLPSIFNKIQQYGLPLTLESAREYIQDIAGIRVICNFVDDIYAMEDMLLKQSDVTLVKRKDYIAEPKENGYRSLHLVVKVPVFLSDRTEDVPVEIQLRTVAMDYWASLEHMLRYKNSNSDMEKVSAMLLDCANTLAETEKTMQYIRENIEE
jgi:putative GTP pyrophosphokinase